MSRSVSTPSSAMLISIQLAQFWQRASDGFSRSVRLLLRHRRRGVDGLGKRTYSTPVKRPHGPDELGNGTEKLRRIEFSECRRTFDQGNLGPPHPREVKLGLGESAGALKQDWILGVAGDLADELL